MVYGQMFDDGGWVDDVGQMMIDSLNLWVLIESLNLCLKAPVSHKEPMNHKLNSFLMYLTLRN